MASRETRLPLSLGVTCLTDLAVGVIAVPTGLALIAAALLLLYWAGWDIDEGIKLVAGLALGGAGVTYVGARATLRAWAYRPSDLLLGDDGIRIDGGGRHRFSLAWSAIESCNVTSRDGGVITIGGVFNEMFGDRGNSMLHQFQIGNAVVAETDDEREARSFREIAAAVAAAVHTRLHPESDEVPAVTESPKPARKPKRGRGKKPEPVAAVPLPEVAIVVCGACGGTVSPSGDAEVTCVHCQAKVAIPDELRARVRAAANLSVQARRAERIVARMLDQPSATQTTAWISVSTLFIAAAWPLTVWAYIHLAHTHRLGFGIGVLVALLPFLLVADGFFLSRLRLVDRLALRSLTLTFGAKPPARDGDPLCCRSCLAPLPAATTTVVDCVYCGAANVTRIDLRGRASRTESSAQSLEAELGKHAKERVWWRIATLVGLACFVATGFLLHHIL